MNGDNTAKENKQILKSFNWYAFPYPVLVVMAYLFIGFLFDVWHPTWLIFLTVPVYYEMIAMSKSHNWYVFPYPVLIAAAYLTMGFLFDVWHPTWLIFLTIPVYYEMIAMSKAKSFRAKANIFPYPILCAIFYLSIGFDYGWWHPAWLLFLTIPIYYMFVNSSKSK